jgi:hypothetical protein
MTEQVVPTTLTEDAKDRRAALAARMHEAIIDELAPENNSSEKMLFQGMDQHVVLGAIAELAELLIVDCSWALSDDFEWRELVNEVCGELLKWVRELEDC